MTTQSNPAWLEEYPALVPAQIELPANQSLVDMLEQSYAQFAHRDALAFMGMRLSFAQLDELSQALGAWLQSKELSKGARVALMMPNVPQYMVGIAAVLRAGYVVVNVNPLYTPRELEHQLKDAGCEAIVILENFASTLQEVLAHVPLKHVVVAAMGDLMPWLKGRVVNHVVRKVKKMVPPFQIEATPQRSVARFKDVIAAGRRMRLARATVGPDDIAFLQYTGGTTGVSKGATLLHRHVLANVLQCEAWFQPMTAKVGGRAMTAVCALPLYHIFALTSCYMMGARWGMMNILIANPRDIPGFIKTLKEFKVHMFPAVNTLLNALVNDPEFAKLDFSELLITNSGGMAVQQATAAKWLKITHCPVVEGYGLSETAPVVTCNRVDSKEYTGTIGLPLPSTQISLRDDAGREVAQGQAGEICIRGPQVMAGYWQRPDETAKVMTADGYFCSGDVGVMDERGYIKIVDRKKDMILVSGFNVYPNEIEQVVSLHPGVLECAVVGVSDEHSGEAVKLFVVKKDPNLTQDDLMAYCRENFTGYKRPKHIEFRTDLPKSNVGKILRRELRPTARS